jgi:hypothetical protein
VTDNAVGSFAGWAAAPGAHPVVGDFNKDGMTDIALVGGPGWTTLPVAFSYGDGNFQITNNDVGGFTSIAGQLLFWNFAASAREAGVQVLTGDFNKDGFTDLALVGGNWGSIRLAMSRGGGVFAMWDRPVGAFADWARAPGVKILAGDFNGDGMTDIALTGGHGWNTIPVATSTGYPDFRVTNLQVGLFPGFASTVSTRAIVGDFNGDGYTDIALVGGAGWNSIPLALGVGMGVFIPVSIPVARFPAWATDSTVSLFAGHVNN